MTFSAIIIKSSGPYTVPHSLAQRTGDEEWNEIEGSGEQEASEYLLAYAPRWAKEAFLRGDIVLQPVD